MGIKYTMRWMVNRMWPRIESGTSYTAQKAKYESSSRSSSSSQFDESSRIHESEPDFFGIDSSKIKLLNMVLRVN
ncbi:hypothetical protein IW140_003427 [Coemansia sp. RSA 1813]|nr:hypothetical protein EV178_003245 [Coemansia sp. RSA 1646]KAJ1767877.1 hypothetical protein LPJ74_005124 [Coemansia sp. RSA 1843]KAJ2089291.1 hypothetical protein IW138_003611 [Coemansia sp. RSA 986]KAJ2569062.1 hypothetical protein IW140_003427 [Coemansia sp. RSA 1813]